MVLAVINNTLSRRRGFEIGCTMCLMLLLLGTIFFVLSTFAESRNVASDLAEIARLHRYPGQVDVQVARAESKSIKGFINQLKDAEVIPDVLEHFQPLLTITVKWANVSANLGNTESPDDMQVAPTVRLVDAAPKAWAKWFGAVWDGGDDVHAAKPQLTLVMTDPDAPSREEPSHSEFCHWIATGFPLTPHASSAFQPEMPEKEGFEEIVSYRPPGPPPKIGKHRYVFAALVPRNGTTAKLHLREPTERAHWGFEHEREGLRQWAEEMGLSVVGANYFYAQNAEQ